MTEIDLTREEVFITNLMKYRPPGNRDPKRDEVPAHMAILKMEVDIVNPDVVVPMGRFSSELFFPPPVTMRDIAGTVYVRRGRIVVPMYHPSWALRDLKHNRKVMSKHIQAVKEAMYR